MKAQREKEEFERIQAEQMKEEKEKKGLTATSGTFEVKAMPEIETTSFNWIARPKPATTKSIDP